MQACRRIKEYLESRGITQAFVSRKTGIEAYKLSQSLNGKRTLTLDEFTAICSALGVEPSEFLDCGNVT